MIIPALPNKDWRNSSLVTRKPTYMPDSRAGRVVKPEHLVERTGDEAVVAGLQLTGSRARAALATGQDPVAVKLEPGAEASGSGSADVSDFDSNAADSPMAHVKLEEGSATPPLPAAEETLEQKAIKALLDGGDGEVKPDLVIKMDEDTLDLRNMPADETDAFRRDVIMRPAEVRRGAWSPLPARQCTLTTSRLPLLQSTLDDYEATPIEAFGEALLRGMGWQPGAAGGTKIHEPKRRPDGLGLGAKERPAAGAGNGAGPAGKGKGKVDRSKRLGRGYVPVIKRERVGVDPMESHLSLIFHGTQDPAPSGSDLSRTGTPSRASSRSPDSKDGRDSRRRRDDRDEERAAVPRGERDRDERYSDSKDDRRDRDRERDRDERRRDRDNRPRDRDSDRDDSRRSERPEVDRRRRDDDGHTRRHRDDRDAERYRSRDRDRDGRRSDRERDDRDRYRERR